MAHLASDQPAGEPHENIQRAVKRLPAAGPVERDDHLPAVWFQRLAHDEMFRLCRQFPVDIAHLIARLILAQLVDLGKATAILWPE